MIAFVTHVFVGLFNRKISQDDFAKLFLQEAEQRDPSNETTYKPESFSVQFAKGGQSFLHNVYEEYTSAKKRDRHHVLERYVRLAMMVPDAHDDFAEVFDKLLPALRPRFYLEHLKLQLELQNPDEDISDVTDTRNFADGHFALSLAIDAEDHIAQVADSQCEEWGVSYGSALEVAKGNLRERSDGAWAAVEFEETGDCIYISSWNDCYEPSRLLIPDIITALEVRGSHVVLCPTRSHMIVIGSEHKEGLEMAMALAEPMQEKDRAVSLVPVILSEEGWQTYHPEDDFPELKSYRVARIMERAEEYAAQKKLLEQVLEVRGVDKFVASFTLYGSEDQSEISMVVATWTRNVETYLPESESIALLDTDEHRVCTVPFAKALEVIPHRLKQLDYYPPRYETIGFPTEEEVVAMGCEYEPIGEPS